jgi:short-subunit dehydrogenase
MSSKVQKPAGVDEALAGKVVVITGASSGFGRGAALAFAEAGATVVLAARREEALAEVARAVEEHGSEALAVETDVGDPVDVAQLIHAATNRYGRIDVWINNAGAGAVGRFDAIPLEDHTQVIETTLLGALYGSYLALRLFRRQRRGILINVASVAGKVASLHYASYSAAKHGVVGLSAALRLELEEDGEETRDIHVCTLLPDAHDTPFFQHAANYTGHLNVPPPPVHDPAEVVDAMLSLAREPRDEVTVGSAAKMAVATNRVSPALAEKMMARSHRKQLDAPEAPNSDGTLLEPAPFGTGVRGGWKKKSVGRKAKPRDADM